MNGMYLDILLRSCEAEMEVLHHVWTLGRATVSEVLESMLRNRKVAYTTVLTLLNKLTRKGYLACDKSGTSYVYSARLNPDDVRRDLLTSLMDKVFLGSPGALVQTLVTCESLSEEDIVDIRKAIDSLEDNP
jgi:predicted transcriptional regulator